MFGSAPFSENYYYNTDSPPHHRGSSDSHAVMNLAINAGHVMPTGGEIYMSQYGGYRVTHRYTGQHDD